MTFQCEVFCLNIWTALSTMPAHMFDSKCFTFQIGGADVTEEDIQYRKRTGRLNEKNIFEKVNKM